LAVPQAVGIAEDGRVVFGWCTACLADTHCDLVEISARGIDDLKLTFTTVPQKSARDRRGSRTGANAVDPSIRLVGLVGFFMLAWGATVIIAGLLLNPRPGTAPSPVGNGSAPLLRVGGAATILLGLMFLTLAANRDGEFRRRLIRGVRWGGLFLCLAISCFAILSGAIFHNPLPVCWAILLPLILSSIAWVLDERANRAMRNVNPWEFPVVSYSETVHETVHPQKPKKRI
jgi:hypothetical protein